MRPKVIGFFLGLFVFIALWIAPTFGSFEASAEEFLGNSSPGVDPRELARSMQIVCGLLLLMITWWITEAIPLPATALLPAIILPVFHAIGAHGASVYEFTLKNVLLNYANPVIYLFLGGFLLAAAMQKWGLARRFILWILTRGNLAARPGSVLLAIMAVAAFLSMWISNTATTAMMLPIGLGILSFAGLKPGQSRYGVALMLGIAWAASIGGVGTIIGTAPNRIALGILNSTFAGDPAYHRITFLDWMLFGVPYVVLCTPLAWLILLRIHRPEIDSIPGGKEKLLEARKELGPLTRGEKETLGVFLLAVLLWVSNPFWDKLLPTGIANQLAWIDEYTIGLVAGVLLFVVPVDLRKGIHLLTWEDAKFVDWGTLILFGGGIALSDALFKTGLTSMIATSFVAAFGSPSTLLMVFAIILLIDFLTEVTSNTAVTTTMVPVIISIALRTGEDPTTLSVAAAVAASMAFMLPVATPPNALVYGTGYIRMKDMIKAGVFLDLLGWLMTVGILSVFGAWVFGVLKL